jgi:hypothetical protein
MTASTTPQTTIQTLTALKDHYEQQQAKTETPISRYADLISHTNALLLGLLTQSNGHATPTATLEQAAIVPVLAAVAEAKPKVKASPAKAKSEATAAPISRISFSLLPTYQGKSKLDAIGTVLDKNQGQAIHQDEIIQELYGELNPESLNVERLRMKTALLQGVKKKFWQKASAPSSYILQASVKPKTTLAKSTTESKTKPATKVSGKRRATEKSPKITPTASGGKVVAADKTASPKQPQIISLQSKTQGTKIILPMHKDFEGLSKLDAIVKVMSENPGVIVNIDDIIERLFGRLSLAEYNAEKGRMKDLMSRGLRLGLWRKANAPLSFIAGEAKVSGRRAVGAKAPAKPKTPTRKPTRSKATRA